MTTPKVDIYLYKEKVKLLYSFSFNLAKLTAKIEYYKEYENLREDIEKVNKDLDEVINTVVVI